MPNTSTRRKRASINEPLYKAGLPYIEQGLHIFPVNEATKKPVWSAKDSPNGKGGHLAATKDPEVWRHLCQRGTGMCARLCVEADDAEPFSGHGTSADMRKQAERSAPLWFTRHRIIPRLRPWASRRRCGSHRASRLAVGLMPTLLTLAGGLQDDGQIGQLPPPSDTLGKRRAIPSSLSRQSELAIANAA